MSELFCLELWDFTHEIILSSALFDKVPKPKCIIIQFVPDGSETVKKGQIKLPFLIGIILTQKVEFYPKNG